MQSYKKKQYLFNINIKLLKNIEKKIILSVYQALTSLKNEKKDEIVLFFMYFLTPFQYLRENFSHIFRIIWENFVHFLI